MHTLSYPFNLLAIFLWLLNTTNVASFATIDLRHNKYKYSTPPTCSQKKDIFSSRAHPQIKHLLSAKEKALARDEIGTLDNNGKSVQSLTDELSIDEIKGNLVDLVSGMTGKDEELRLVEAYVNALEDRYTPVQTLGFLNMAMAGDWQLLFSTNLSLTSIRNFRLRELFQRVEPKQLEGIITNEALWDLAEGEESGDTGVPQFDSTGTFSVVSSYKINQGSRMILDLEDHLLKPSKGSKIPKNVPKLVGKLHRAMPKEIFDPNDHAMDTTYLDADFRIVRMTGPRFEGVRDIFIRRGSFVIDPTKEA